MTCRHAAWSAPLAFCSASALLENLLILMQMSNSCPASLGTATAARLPASSIRDASSSTQTSSRASANRRKMPRVVPAVRRRAASCRCHAGCIENSRSRARNVRAMHAACRLVERKRVHCTKVTSGSKMSSSGQSSLNNTKSLRDGLRPGRPISALCHAQTPASAALMAMS